MVNGALILVLARGQNLSDGGAEQPGMAEAIPQTTTAAATGPSVRAPLAAAIAISAFTLSVATFELAMADWPSGFVLLAVVPLMALRVLRLRPVVRDAVAAYPERRREVCSSIPDLRG